MTLNCYRLTPSLKPQQSLDGPPPSNQTSIIGASGCRRRGLDFIHRECISTNPALTSILLSQNVIAPNAILFTAFGNLTTGTCSMLTSVHDHSSPSPIAALSRSSDSIAACFGTLFVLNMKSDSSLSEGILSLGHPRGYREVRTPRAAAATIASSLTSVI